MRKKANREKSSKEINVLYIHDRPSGGAGESLYQMIYNNALWLSKGAVFMTTGFLKEKFEKLKPALKIYYIAGGGWLGAVKDKPWLFGLTKIYQFPKSYKYYQQIRSIAEKESIDVIHTNTINIIEGGILAKKKGIPHFIQVRELLDIDYYSYPISKKWIIKNLHQYSDMLIANSERTKAGLLKLNADENKIRVIYNAVSPTKRQLNIRELLGLPLDTKVVAIVGWITPNKKVEDFLEIAYAFQDRSDTKFVIIGDYGFSEVYNNKIRGRLEQLTNVIHAGLITNATEYMASFDLLICTCYTESFGRTVAEALIAGTPALGVESCAVAELIQHGKSGFVVPESDIVTFVKYTKLLLDDDELNVNMSKFGQEDAEKRFGLETIRNQYLELYQEFVK
jgi:glycosyltransferase involved in cell wall biosynthesis